jgi:hypothetical protein
MSEGLRPRAKWRAVTVRAQSVKDRPKEDLLAAPSMTPPGYRRVTTSDRCFERRKINLSTVVAGQNVGVKQVSDRIWWNRNRFRGTNRCAS